MDSVLIFCESWCKDTSLSTILSYLFTLSLESAKIELPLTARTPSFNSNTISFYCNLCSQAVRQMGKAEDLVKVVQSSLEFVFTSGGPFF
jgi:hypothetical protein